MSVNKNIKILLVEDAAVMRKMEKKVLYSLGFNNVQEATDGVVAEDILASDMVDLIISDWNMPNKDGFELLKSIRANEKLKTIPFIMATGRGEKKEINKASEAGVSAFIAKPFNGEELNEKINEAFGFVNEEEVTREYEVNKEGKVKLKVGHIQITDHLVLGVLRHLIETGEATPEHFELETECMSSWNPVAKALEKNKIDAACVLAPIAMDLYADSVPIKLVLFAHKNGSIFVRNKKGEEYAPPFQDFFKGKSFYIPHFMSIHHMLSHMFFSQMGLKAGTLGKDKNDVNFEVVPPIKMPELLSENKESSGYLVAEPLGTKAIASGIAELQFLSSELWENHPCCVVTMQNEFIEKFPDAVYEFTKLLVEAGQFIDKKPGLAAEIGVKFLDPNKKLGLKVPILKNVLTEPLGIKTNDLYPVVEDLDRMQKYMHDEMGIGRLINVNEFVDLRFANKACKDGGKIGKRKSKLNNTVEHTAELLQRGAISSEEKAKKALLNMEGKYLIFGLEEQEFGIDIMKVREIINMQTIRSIPYSPEHILGVITLRNSVIPIIDLKKKMGYQNYSESKRRFIIVVELERKDQTVLAGVVVDSVSDVKDIVASEIEMPPKYSGLNGTNYIMAMYKNNGSIRMLLEIANLLNTGETLNLAEIAKSAAA
ncbi:MAG: chemotaxis protein CheW [Ignavibacteria bacterium]|jgi:chemotaxis signal transduction protein/ABC-type nitrate/sulfonate/bicarbonate transport system substrate-binding protein/AmiR/NasT family two-component response regulator